MSQIDLNPDRLPLPKPERTNPKKPKYIKTRIDTKWVATRKEFLSTRSTHAGLYICEFCGKHTENPDVDHILLRSNRPDLKYTLSNLRALCKRCHQERHNQFF